MPEKSTIIETLITIAASFGFGGLMNSLVAKMLGRRKEDVSIALEEQKLYRTLLEDYEVNRKKDAETISELTGTVGSLRSEVGELKSEVLELIQIDKDNKELLLRWENSDKEKDVIIRQRNEIIASQETELEKLRQ
jgi:hypothetical protein